MTIDGDALQRAMFESSRYLQRSTSFGADQEALLDAIDLDLVMHAAQWDSLRAALGAMRPQVRDHVAHSLTLIGGKLIMGDNFENISGSQITNRSTVVNAFNSLSGSENDEIREALREIVAAVESTGNADAADVAETLVEEVAGSRKPAVVAALWQKLRELAPVVRGLATASAVIIRLVSGG